MKGSPGAGRIVAIVAVALVAVALFMLLRNGGESYEVTAEFQNASQLVNGNEVLIGGNSAGTIKEIELGDNGQALVTFTVNDEFAPLPRGTIATIRQSSLSSVAGRQIYLDLPPAGESEAEIEDGGSLSQAETVSAVDLDEVFNTLDTKTVKDFKRVVKGFRDSYEGVSEQANKGFRYANPFLSTSRRVFGELTRDTRAFESLIVDTAKLSGLLAERDADISQLVGNANAALGAIGSRRAELARAISLLPDFMRQANTTFVNLRAALTDLNPLVDASKPVADRLGPFFREFRAAAADAVPAIRDLSGIVRRKGRANDLVELTRLQVPLARIGVGSGMPDCGTDPLADFEQAADDDFTHGALGETACGLQNQLPQVSHIRAYIPEWVGWFDSFSTSGTLDASGGIGRIALTLNAFSPALLAVGDLSTPLNLPGLIAAGLDIDARARCPGANERNPGDGSTPFTDGGALNCDPAQVPPGQ